MTKEEIENHYQCELEYILKQKQNEEYDINEEVKSVLINLAFLQENIKHQRKYLPLERLRHRLFNISQLFFNEEQSQIPEILEEKFLGYKSISNLTDLLFESVAVLPMNFSFEKKARVIATTSLAQNMVDIYEGYYDERCKREVNYLRGYNYNSPILDEKPVPILQSVFENKVMDIYTDYTSQEIGKKLIKKVSN